MSIFVYIIGMLLIIIPPSLTCSSSKITGTISSSFSSTSTFVSSTSRSSRTFGVEETPKENIKFNPGDIISCAIEPGRLGSHVMLAMTAEKVVHIPGPESDGGNATVIELTTYLAAAKNSLYCELRTKDYDAEFKRSCGTHRFRSVTETKAAAQESLDLFLKNGRFHYDKYDCNCEHWVLAWKYGVAWSLQINSWTVWADKYISNNCQAPAKVDSRDNCHSRRNASS